MILTNRSIKELIWFFEIILLYSDKLYVNESVQRKIWVYDIVEEGFIKNKQEFISFEDFGLDGMRCDGNGNIYVCRYGKGTIAIISPEGILLKEIELKGKKPTNITFSNDYKKCYITIADRGCIEIVKLWLKKNKDKTFEESICHWFATFNKYFCL